MTRVTTALLFAIVAASAIIVACKKDSTTQPTNNNPADTTHVPSIIGGQYLANTLMQCDGCHTPIDSAGNQILSKVYAGGMRFNLGPVGVVYSRNITSDGSQGIGPWSDAQIKAAITRGVVPEHYIGSSLSDTLLASVMPYYLYANLNDTDLVDLVAYVRNVPPNATPSIPDTVNAVVRTHIDKVTLPDAASMTDQLRRGKYLVAIGLCADCHTPLDAQGHLDMTKFLAGGRDFDGFLPGVTVHSANITPDNATGIGGWSDAQVRTALTTGVDDKGRHLCPPMPWKKFKNLTSSDLDAIIAYIRTVAPVSNAVGDNPDCPN